MNRQGMESSTEHRRAAEARQVRFRRPVSTTRLLYSAIASLLLCCSCMHAVRSPRGASSDVPGADSATVLLWRFDESGGDHVGDDGPFHLDAVAGSDTRGGFGRWNGARHFARSTQSFAYTPYVLSLDVPGPMTIEAWVQPEAYGSFEDTPIAARWTERANEQSWLFSITGVNVGASLDVSSPGYHRSLIQQALTGHLLFAIQPDDAGRPVAFSSVAKIELNRWTHVAVTFDGELIRFYIDGALDSQYAFASRIRQTQAPLLVGNYFDTHLLTSFGGVLSLSGTADTTPYYAYTGFIDHFRISNVARSEFPGVGRR